MRIIGKKIGRELNLLTGLGRPVAIRCDKFIRHERDGLAWLCHDPFRHHHLIAAAEPGRTGARFTGLPLGHDGPTGWHCDQQRIGAERFRDIRIPVALAAHIDAFRPDMSGRLTGRHKTKMARISRRIVDDAMVVNIQRHQPRRHNLRGNGDLLNRLRRGTMSRARTARRESRSPTWPILVRVRCGRSGAWGRGRNESESAAAAPLESAGPLR